MNALEQVDVLNMKLDEAKAEGESLKNSILEYGQFQFTQGWDQAMAQAGSAGSSDKIYSEEEMNQIIQEEKAPLELQIASLAEQINAVPGMIEQGKQEAVAELKAALKAQYEDQQVAESAGEVGFKSLLE